MRKVLIALLAVMLLSTTALAFDYSIRADGLNAYKYGKDNQGGYIKGTGKDRVVIQWQRLDTIYETEYGSELYGIGSIQVNRERKDATVIVYVGYNYVYVCTTDQYWNCYYISPIKKLR